jgi:hypothetical protein
VVHRRLLPFVTGLGPLPGALRPAGTLSPTRLYAGVLAQIPDSPAAIDPDMLLLSQHLASAIMSPEWREVIRRSD